jgi:hypothetical protein
MQSGQRQKGNETMNRRWSTRTLAVAAAAVAVAGGGSAAIAASQGSASSPSGFLDAVAKHLGISSEKLQDATKAAAIDQVDAALSAGTITQAQADALKERIQSGEVPFFARGPFGGFHGGGHLGQHLAAAASYLGLTAEELRTKLEAGQSLADVAKAQGKSVDGLEQTILDDEKKELDQAVADGRLTRAQADAILERKQARIDDIVNGTFPRLAERGFGFGGAPPAARFFGAAA